MSKIFSPAAVLLSVALLVTLLQHAGAQRRYGRSSYRTPRNLYGQQLVRRIDLLEQRVRILDRLANLATPDSFSAAPAHLTVESAQQQLAEAEERLKTTEYQFRKGAASEAEVEARKFERQRARLLVKLGTAAQNDQPTKGIEAEIEIVGAEHYLATAKRSLDLTQRLAAKGLARPSNLDAHKQAVEEAQKLLAQAIEKAKGNRESNQSQPGSRASPR